LHLCYRQKAGLTEKTVVLKSVEFNEPMIGRLSSILAISKQNSRWRKIMKRSLVFCLMLPLSTMPAFSQSTDSNKPQDETKRSPVTILDLSAVVKPPMNLSTPKNDFQMNSVQQSMAVGRQKGKFPGWATKTLIGVGVAAGTALLLYKLNRGNNVVQAGGITGYCSASGWCFTSGSTSIMNAPWATPVPIPVPVQ
jgi:hypothetical protein